MKKEVGYRIRKIRESKDLSQQNIADALAISPGAYSKIERGETDPSIGRLQQIAEILKVPVTSFINETTSFSDNNLANPQDNYGFATKEDLEEIHIAINKLQRDIASIMKKG